MQMVRQLQCSYIDANVRTVLPSAIHPSYPYGNPTNPSHPAARPRRPADPSSRALFQDTGFGGGGVNDAMQWTDLAIDVLLPKDEEREARARAATARKLASGAATHQQPQQAQAQQQDITFEGEEAENDENLNDIDEDTEDGTLDEDD